MSVAELKRSGAQAIAFDDQGVPIMKTMPAKGDLTLPRNMHVGSAGDQGDVVMQFLGELFFTTQMGREAIEFFGIDLENLIQVTEPEQIVLGTGVGSRHVVMPNEHLFRAETMIKHPLVAGFYLLKPGHGAEYRKSHPEHADVVSRVPGWYVHRPQRMVDFNNTGITDRNRMISRTQHRVTSDGAVAERLGRYAELLAKVD